MSIKSEIRIIEQKQLPVANSDFMDNDLSDWTDNVTYGSAYKPSTISNSARMKGETSTLLERTLKQDITHDWELISSVKQPGYKPYRVDYKVTNIPMDSTSGMTMFLGGESGTTRYENGDYFDIFWVLEKFNEIESIYGSTDDPMTTNVEQTTYSIFETIEDTYNQGGDIYTSGGTSASSGWYKDGNDINGVWYYWNGTSWTDITNGLTSYFDVDSCDPLDYEIKYSYIDDLTYTTMSECYTNSELLYADAPLTTYNTYGKYTNSLTTPINYFAWNQFTGVWDGAGECIVPTNSFIALRSVSGDVTTAIPTTVYSNYTSVEETIDNGGKLYSDTFGSYFDYSFFKDSQTEFEGVWYTVSSSFLFDLRYFTAYSTTGSTSGETCVTESYSPVDIYINPIEYSTIGECFTNGVVINYDAYVNINHESPTGSYADNIDIPITSYYWNVDTWGTSYDCPCIGMFVDAGYDQTIITGETYTLGSADASGYTSLLWTTDGTGTFDDDTIIHPTYTHSVTDFDNSGVTLTLTASCGINSIGDTMELRIVPIPHARIYKDNTLTADRTNVDETIISYKYGFPLDGNNDAELDDEFYVSYSGSTNMVSPGVSYTQTDGRILVDPGPSMEYKLIRFNTDGSLDYEFTENFKSLSTSFDGVIKQQDDGKLLVTCGVYNFDNNGVNWEANGLMRLNKDGSLDKSFFLNQNNSSDYDIVGGISSIIIQDDGKIIFDAGFRLDGNVNPEYYPSIVRVDTNGSRDLTYDNDINDSFYLSRNGNAISITHLPDDNDKILVQHTYLLDDDCDPSFPELQRWRTYIKRFDSGGTIDTTYTGNYKSSWGTSYNTTFDNIEVRDGKLWCFKSNSDINYNYGDNPICYNSTPVVDIIFSNMLILNYDGSAFKGLFGLDNCKSYTITENGAWMSFSYIGISPFTPFWEDCNVIQGPPLGATDTHLVYDISPWTRLDKCLLVQGNTIKDFISPIYGTDVL